MNTITALSPIILLIVLITTNLIVFENTMSGPNQIALFLASLFAVIIGYNKKINFSIYLKSIILGIKDSIKSSINAMIILLIIGALCSTWILSGIVPAMIYYGIELINPNYFLFTICIISAVVSMATGSSWTTTATIGIAIMSIGDLLTFSPGLTAGAIISGAYFGDKMSPLSETTNLAPSVSGSDLFNHIKYMSWTTIPSIILSLLCFYIIGLSNTNTMIETESLNNFLNTIENTWNISNILFIIPLFIIILIYMNVPAYITLITGTILAIIFSIILQSNLIDTINLSQSQSTFQTIINTVLNGNNFNTDDEQLRILFNKGGVTTMLWIVFLVISAMTFGGVMYKGGFLEKITNQLMMRSSNDSNIIISTAGSCLFFNITTCDQYLSIVIPGRMFKEKYQEYNLSPLNLSRTIEDCGTVTSVLIPWNSCSLYHSGVLSIDPLLYIPFSFFNLISPIMTVLFAYFNIKIKKNKDVKEK